MLGRNDEAARAFTEKKMKRIKSRLTALKEHGGDGNEIQTLEKIIKEVESWQR